MDINLFRKSLASRQQLLEGLSNPKIKDLYDQMHSLPRAGSLRKMAEITENVYAHLQELQKQDKFSFNRKAPKLLSRLETLIDMLYDAVHIGIDPSEAEILQTEIMADLLRL